VTLLICASVLAVLAAIVGRRLAPSRRRRRAQQRRWAVMAAHRHRIAGQMARDPQCWERWWAERAAQGLDDETDVLRGGM